VVRNNFTEVSDSGQEVTPKRYTEALHRTVFKLTPAPLIKKKQVRFKNNSGSDIGSFLGYECAEDGGGER
jgi:hypothetical protein